MRILVTGASGLLGAYVVDRLIESPHEIVAWSGRSCGARRNVRFCPVELTDEGAVLTALADTKPDAVIHAGAVSSAEAVRRDPHRAHAVNVDATRLISCWAAEHNRRLVFTSTDLVFEGERSWYRENDPARPVLAYGQSKLAAERFVLGATKGLVARISLLYGHSRSGSEGFFDRAVAALGAGEAQTFFADEFRTPLDFDTAARLLVRLAESDTCGTVHLGGIERLSRFELMSRAATALGIDSGLVRANVRADLPLPEPRPADVSLDCSRLRSLFPDFISPRIEQALACHQ